MCYPSCTFYHTNHTLLFIPALDVIQSKENVAPLELFARYIQGANLRVRLAIQPTRVIASHRTACERLSPRITRSRRANPSLGLCSPLGILGLVHDPLFVNEIQLSGDRSAVWHFLNVKGRQMGGRVLLALFGTHTILLHELHHFKEPFRSFEIEAANIILSPFFDHLGKGTDTPIIFLLLTSTLAPRRSG